MPSTPMYAPIQTAPLTGVTTDYSGTFGAPAFQAIPVNPKRIGLIIRNPSSANAFYVNFGALPGMGTAGTIPVPPLGELVFTQFLPSESVCLIGAAGDWYTVKEIN